MNKPIFIFAFILACLLGLGYYSINNIPKIRNLAEKAGLKETPKKFMPRSYNGVFVIFDPSGSGMTTNSVPRITTSFLNDIIDSIQKTGYGDIWLSYIVRSAYSTDVLHFTISQKPMELNPPVRHAGERLGEFHLREKEFSKDSLFHASEIQKALKSITIQKSTFLKECNMMISKAYGPKKPGQDYSDIIGALNSALRVFSTVSYDSTHFRSILLISDAVQDVPKSAPHETLSPIPADIRVVQVDHSGSRNNMLSGTRALEIGSLDRAKDFIIRTHKPKNQ